jgi:hypothetical protein
MTPSEKSRPIFFLLLEKGMLSTISYTSLSIYSFMFIIYNDILFQLFVYIIAVQPALILGKISVFTCLMPVRRDSAASRIRSCLTDIIGFFFFLLFYLLHALRYCCHFFFPLRCRSLSILCALFFCI